MKYCRLFSFTMALLASGVSRAGTNAPLPNATSASGQFIAYAADAGAPVLLCNFAERIKQSLLHRLDIPDRWRDSIVLVVRENSTGAALRIFQIGPVVKYEISCRLPADEPVLRAAVIEALCLEIANRDRPAGSTPWTSAQVPLWLVQGLAGMLPVENEWLLSVARRLATAVHPPEARAVLRQAELPADEMERSLFRARAWVLTDGLLRLPAGGQKLQRLLSELRQPGDTFAKVYRTDFANAAALEKWWRAAQARWAATLVPQDLTAAETAQRLTAWLVFPGGQAFTNLYRVVDQSWLKQTLPGRLNELEQLHNRAHPLYWSALAAYLEAGQWLAEDKISRYRRAVEHAEKLRQEARREAEAINVTLDGAELAYGSGTSSNVWRGYFRTIEQLEEFERGRHDPIRDYFDQLDR